MNGFNEKFMKETAEFLRTVVIAESEGLKKENPPKGVYNFDLENLAKDFAYLVRAPAGYNKAGEDLIRAYWLPWKSGQTTEIKLGTKAEYFFTSHLEGCQLRIVPPKPPNTKIKVLHIAGDTGGQKGRGPKGTEWRAEQAKKALKPSELQRSRAFSSTVLPKSGGYKDPDDEGEDADATVVGYKGKDGWELWAQVTDDSGFHVKSDGGAWKFYP
jgi:hypothetical protein